jgi:nucleotidyltransferase substrate binding protein (TIGR01987 family)
MPEEEIRWHYRFQNFSRALRRLQDALKEGAEALNELEQEGVIQRFEYTFDLAWNTLKDRLEHDGIVLSPVTPRAVIRRAFQAKLISEGERWIDMLADRNRMSHTYDSDTFDAIIKEIEERYLDRLAELHGRLNREMAEPGTEES